MTQANVKTTFFGSISRFVPAIASTLAALTTVLSFLFSSGAFGKPDSLRNLTGNGAAWINLSPNADTAYSIGDTLHLAAIVTDRSGAVIAGSHPAWSSDNPRVARVREDGSVLAVSEGSAVILAAVDGRTARARVVVRQHIASVRLVGDSSVTLPEGEHLRARVQPLDARGHAVNGRLATWTVDDSSIVTVDSAGVLAGLVPGRVLVRGTVEGLTALAIVTVVPTPSSIAIAAGDGQHALAKTTLPQPVIVRVLSRQGHPVEGTLVRFRPMDGAGTAEPSSSLTDAEGRARTTWALGDLPGRQTLLATVDHLDSTRTIVAEVEPVAANTVVTTAPEGIGGVVSASLAEPLMVRLTDSTGRVLPNVPVSWTALDGSVVTNETTRTDSLGEARARWQFGSRSGHQRVRVLIGTGRSVPPVIFTGNALAGSIAALTVVSGDRQTGAAGAALPRPIVLRVADSVGNPVVDAAVSLTPSQGSVADSVVRTDSAGRATVRWTMGHTAQPHVMRARVGSLRRVELAARAVAGAAENIVFDSMPATGVAGKPLSRAVSATVKDLYGNAVADAQVRFSTKTGTVSPATVATDASGRLRVKWTLGTKPGEQTLTAAVRGGDTHASVMVDASAPTSAPAAKKVSAAKAPAAKARR